ncbi:sugar (pentulose or hexulose) kinase [Paenibacillus endophyticus]|uniref:Sugar (Pentulose or hexulose) kinase n=1 Tax=Paenibacillus endophyticus TaxID=1294268 RepID=A0A7W5G826_9BACL|nr:FGGY family carbohydrate kinase [Paenibacillus endophyticus]MBB3150594.1 sugar (pentulose or hexulose) kinase [Paenibacillus endophyticus]
MLLAIDIGTTNIKVGLVGEYGNVIARRERVNRKLRHKQGYVYYDPEQLWQMTASLIKETTESAGVPEIRAIGITSMAESGVLIGRKNGEPKSHLIPWFDTLSIPQAETIEQEINVRERFIQTGMVPSFKQGLAKLLWLRELNPESLEGSVWLSASAFIAFRLTGCFAEEYTLAARTFAFRIDERKWDEALIRHFGLNIELFPPAIPTGASVGTVMGQAAEDLGLQGDTLVCLAGHDHICASLIAQDKDLGGVYNSMGTAETLVGIFEDRPLRNDDYCSGLSFGLHPLKDRMYWIGGHSSSGGSVEWLRELISDGELTYEQLITLLEQIPSDSGPTGILYFPYLSGSGAPHTNHYARAAFVGLSALHSKAEILKALLEGNAYQLEMLRRQAEKISGQPIKQMTVVGGGAKNPIWLQIKADVSDVTLRVPSMADATILAAAVIAGVGAKVYTTYEEAMTEIERPASRLIHSHPERHGQYKQVYEQGFAALSGPILRYDEWQHKRGMESYIK